MLPLGWLLARFLIKPIQQLVLASERIRSMDFTHAPLPHTQVRELNDLIDASESMKVTIRDFIGLVSLRSFRKTLWNHSSRWCLKQRCAHCPPNVAAYGSTMANNCRHQPAMIKMVKP
ncbi:hypothetical protein [Paludibacterium denitrificans]|nr:hypothetical protein [Paludibacterium denitrificans]